MALVQSAITTGGKSGTVTVTLGSSVTSGNLVVVGVGWDNSGVTVNSVKQGGLTSLTQLQAGTVGTGGYAFYYLKTTSTLKTFDVNFSSGVGAEAWAAEYSGSVELQSFTDNSGTSTTPTASSDGDSDTTLNVCLFVANTNRETYSSPTGGFTIERQANGSMTTALIDQPSGASSATPSATIGSSATWDVVHATFKDEGQQILTLRQMGY